MGDLGTREGQRNTEEPAGVAAEVNGTGGRRQNLKRISGNSVESSILFGSLVNDSPSQATKSIQEASETAGHVN